MLGINFSPTLRQKRVLGPHSRSRVTQIFGSEDPVIEYMLRFNYSPTLLAQLSSRLDFPRVGYVAVRSDQ